MKVTLLGEKLKTLRGSLSLFDVEKGTGISRATIRDYERSKYPPPPESLKKLAEYYEIPYVELRTLYFEDAYSDPEDIDAMRRCVERTQRR